MIDEKESERKKSSREQKIVGGVETRSFSYSYRYKWVKVYIFLDLQQYENYGKSLNKKYWKNTQTPETTEIWEANYWQLWREVSMYA